MPPSLEKKRQQGSKDTEDGKATHTQPPAKGKMMSVAIKMTKSSSSISPAAVAKENFNNNSRQDINSNEWRSTGASSNNSKASHTTNNNKQQHVHQQSSTTRLYESQNSWEQQALPEMLQLQHLAQLRLDAAPSQSIVAASRPPSLQRSEGRKRAEQEPGAYMEAPGHDAVRREKTQIYHHHHATTTGDDEERETARDAHDDDVEQGPIIRDSALLQAMPVWDEDDSVDTQATPVACSEEERLARKRTRLIMATILSVTLGVFLIVGLFFLIFSVILVKENHNVVVTVPPSTMMELVPDLPDYTIDAILKNPTTPQARANEWLLRDPKFHNYTQSCRLQRFALATFFYATTTTSGSNNNETTTSDISARPNAWVHDTHWLSYDHHECDWYGQTHIYWEQGVDLEMTSQNPCNANRTYERLWLADNGLEGGVPPELYMLSSLTSIDMSDNREMTWSISSRIASLTNLEHLACSRSGLTGTIPTELGKLSKLESVRLVYNRLSGSIPTQVGQLTNLERLC